MVDFIHIEKRDFFLAASFAVIGLLISMKSVLLFLAKLNPWQGLLIYYVVVFVAIFTLSKLGLTIFDIQIKNAPQVLGIILIFFSFFILFNWTNAYVQYVTMGNFSAASQVLFQSEDGSVWYLWSLIIPATTALNIQMLRILTFVVTPFMLAFLGGLLIKGKADLGGAF